MSKYLGEQFGNYQLLQLLGSGGFGSVYLGEHIYLKTQGVVKVFHTHLFDQDQQKLFLETTQSIGQLNHPHILEVLDSGIRETIPFVAMEYAANGNIRQRHPAGSQIPANTVVNYINQIASALRYAHEQKLVHGDIRPENMLLVNNELLLSDFGIPVIAQVTQDQGKQNDLAAVTYMAPEQIRGKVRQASDQYALAAVAYEWLCGTPPFEGVSYVDVARKHLQEPVPALSQKMPNLAPAVTSVLSRALAKDPRQRFESIGRFADALDQALRFATEPAPAPELTEPDPEAIDEALPPALVEAFQREQAQEAIPVPTPVSAPLQTPSAGSRETLAQPHSTPSRRKALGIIGGVAVLAVGGLSVILYETQRGKGSGLSAQTTRVASVTPTPTQTPTPTSTVGNIISTYSKHSGPVDSLSWSPDGKQIVSASEDKTIQVWEALTGNQLFVRNDYPALNNETGVTWSPKGDVIASNSINQIINIWDVTTQQTVIGINEVGGQPLALAWSPDGAYLAVTSLWGYTQVRSARTGDLIVTLRQQQSSSLPSGEYNSVQAVAWSPDGKYVATGSADGGVQVWNPFNGALLSNFTGHINPVTYTGQGANPLSFLRGLRAGRAQASGDAYSINSLSWSPDSTQIVSTGADRTVQISDAFSGKNILTFSQHAGSVLAVSWSPDGKYLVSGDNTGLELLWDTTGKTLFTYRGQKKAIYCLAWSPDGQLIASGSEDGSVQIWKTN